MAHSDHHLFARLPHNTHTRTAITAAETPALHFHWYLGGCLASGSEGKGRDKSNTKVQFKRCWHGNAESGPGIVCSWVGEWKEALWENTHDFFYWWIDHLEWVKALHLRDHLILLEEEEKAACSTSSGQRAPPRAQGRKPLLDWDRMKHHSLLQPILSFILPRPHPNFCPYMQPPPSIVFFIF